jgi:hypothetical protein
MPLSLQYVVEPAGKCAPSLLSLEGELERAISLYSLSRESVSRGVL